MKRNLLTVLLGAGLFCVAAPWPAHAAVSDGLYEYHREDGDSDSLSSGASVCSHVHTEDCYGDEPEIASGSNARPAASPKEKETLNCAHLHDDSCGYMLPPLAPPSGFMHDLSSPSTAVRRKARSVDTVESDTVYLSGTGSDTTGDGSKDRPYKNFQTAVSKVAENGRIIVQGNVMVDVLGASGDIPLIIDKSVTVEGGHLSLRTAGIVLGADVTFQNITIEFNNSVRNAIIANGYSLTLENVKKYKGSSWGEPNEIHLFCGHIAESQNQAPAGGGHGEITIRGTDNDLGNIYAGNFLDLGAYDETVESNFTGDATITIEPGTKGNVGRINACGAREDRRGGNPNGMWTGIDSKFKIQGTVDINLNGSFVKQVYGGADRTAQVTFNTSLPVGNLSLVEIGSLTVGSGSLKPDQLTGNTDITIEAGAELDLSAVIQKGYTFLVKDFTGSDGSGKLVMKDQDKLAVTGTISGVTEFQTDRIRPMDKSTSGYAEDGWPYIAVPPGSPSDSFTFHPFITQAGMTLTLAGNQWITSLKQSAGGQPSQPQDLAGMNITIEGVYTYNGSAQKPAVMANGKALAEMTDYTIEAYKHSRDGVGQHTNAGTVTVEIRGKGDYTGQATADFKIERAASVLRITAAISEAGKSPQVTLTSVVDKAGRGVSPTGTVVFTDITGSNPSASGVSQALVDGKAVYTQTGLAEQRYTFEADYSGDTNYTPSKTTVTFDVTILEQIVKEPITQVPERLKNIYPTISELTKTLKKQLVAKGGSGYTEENTKTFDMKLQLSADKGGTWTDATNDNFPKDGVTIELMYGDFAPSGVSGATHDFLVTHMFDDSVNGFAAGQLEYPEVTETETGIRFTVKGLSPVGIAWKAERQGGEAPNHSSTSDGGGDKTTGGSGGAASGGGGGTSGGRGGTSGGGGRTSGGGGGGHASGSKAPGVPGSIAAASGRWVKDEAGWRYCYAGGNCETGQTLADSQGNAVEYISWKQIDGVWWAFGANGYLKEGWVLDNASGRWYYIDVNLGMKTGWHRDLKDGFWYYLDPQSGAMRTGRQFIDGAWYNFNSVSQPVGSDASQSGRLPLGALC